MIRLPSTLEQARQSEGRIRAGGTDELELRRRGITHGPIVDLRDVPGLDQIEPLAGGGMRIGARVTLAHLAADATVRAGWSGLAAAAGELATPQIRARATVAGSLLQQVRCWYYRSPAFDCLKKGGASCFAREGDYTFHSALDRSSCIAPHPSTMACALWAFDATVEVSTAGGEVLRDIPTLLGTGTDPRRTHDVAAHEVVTAVVLAPPTPGDRSAYVRTIHRARAEWPLVEAVARVRLSEQGRIASIALCAGGIAVRPVRFPEIAEALLGLEPTDPQVAGTLSALSAPAPSLPATAYKARLIPPTLLAALGQALNSVPVPGASGRTGGSGGQPGSGQAPPSSAEEGE